jgi:YD repeat-containing protein
MRNSWKRQRIVVMTSLAIVALTAMAPRAQSAEIVSYTYDELGRIISATYPDGKKISYYYDATGNRTQQVVSANTAPVAGDDFGEIHPDQSTQVIIGVTSNDSDPGDTFSITSFTNGAEGTVTQLSGGALRYTYTGHPFGWDTYDSFTYTITDSFGLPTTATVNVTIYCVTSPPGGIC